MKAAYGENLGAIVIIISLWYHTLMTSSLLSLYFWRTLHKWIIRMKRYFCRRDNIYVFHNILILQNLAKIHVLSMISRFLFYLISMNDKLFLPMEFTFFVKSCQPILIEDKIIYTALH